MKIKEEELNQFDNLITIAENSQSAREEYFEKLAKKYCCNSEKISIDMQTGEIKID